MCQYVLGGSVKVISLVALTVGGKMRGRKVTRPVWDVLLLDCGSSPRGRHSMCQVCVGWQCEGHFSRALAGGGRVEGLKSDLAIGEETHFWIMCYTPAWQAQHVPNTC